MNFAPSSSTQWDDAWVEALTSLEMDVAEAESMLALDRVFDQVTRDPWTPPTNLGPLPAHLVDRARTLLARQLSVSQQLASAARNSRKHDRALAQLHATASSPPVYVDTPA